MKKLIERHLGGNILSSKIDGSKCQASSHMYQSKVVNWEVELMYHLKFWLILINEKKFEKGPSSLGS